MSEKGNFWGNLILQLRTEQNISQRQLAAGAKVNRSTLRRIEEGRARGDIEIMEKLLNYLGYELEAMTQASLHERMKQRITEASDPNQKSKMAAIQLLKLNLAVLLVPLAQDLLSFLLISGA